MPVTLASLQDLNTLPYDEVLDVRSPSEFAEDHLPRAVNLPVLNDEERAAIGAVYVQESKFRARKMGAALVARNAARHLETWLADKEGHYRPLIYCWRGGQRSNALATILSQIGWRAGVIAGGYKHYRQLVVKALYENPFPSPVVLLDGDTGTGKTDILRLLSESGVQVIDLERLANHRGSLFGGPIEHQPSQKTFESRLAMQVAALDPARPVVIEAESSKIGARIVPPSLWKAMRPATRLRLTAPVHERASYLVARYGDLIACRGAFLQSLDRMRPLHSKQQIEDWRSLLEAGRFSDLAEALIVHHYDPRYRKHRRRADTRPETEIALSSLSIDHLERAARRIAEILSTGMD
ncbi:MAG: tRNA 2-selenouridine(34) synthase MnmH [Alphaproteobacteria bacterium]